MFEQFNRIFVALTISFALVAAGGCGGDKAKETKKTTRSKNISNESSGADYQTFAALPKAQTKAELPYLLGPDGVEGVPCFKPGENLTPQDAGYDIKRLVEENSQAVNRAIANWIVEDLNPSGLSETMALRWEIAPENLVVAQVPDDEVRFVDDQRCIESGTGWLGNGVHAVTTLIGARKFSFSTTIPLDMETQEELTRAVGMENIVLESPDIFVYEPVSGADGQPAVTSTGEPLYTSPDGTHIPESKVPPPERRTMKEWTLTSEAPIYFAFRELSNEAWRKESKKDDCDVYLVWGDVTPRPPDCEDFQESAFVATKKDGEVAVTITTDGENKGVVLGYGKGEMLQVNDRIILWLSPKKIEEGVVLKLNSLVLNPKASSGVSRTKTETSTYVPTKSPSRDEEAPVAKKSKKKEKEKEKEKDKGKDKAPVSDEDSLDAFLND